MSLPSEASIQPSEIKRIQEALDKLNPESKSYDAHAPREISIKVNLHVHQEYPKLLYKGAGVRDSIRVHDDKAEKEARDKGYGEHVPEVLEEA